MFCNEHEPLALLVELTPKLAKKRFRNEIYKAWNCKCCYCGNEATSLDHIVPRFKSGSTTRNNLIPACVSCNKNKGSEDMEAWFKKQAFYKEDRLEKIKHWMRAEVIDLISYQLESKNISFVV
jgi:5-methylcytosine-specific restriction endonuclease McrA